MNDFHFIIVQQKLGDYEFSYELSCKTLSAQSDAGLCPKCPHDRDPVSCPSISLRGLFIANVCLTTNKYFSPTPYREEVWI